MLTKVCTKCKVERPIDDFSIDKRVKSGHQARCNVCKNYYNKIYYADEENRRKIQTQKREYNRRPEVRERDRVYRSTDRVKKRRRATDKKTPRHIFYATLSLGLKRRPADNPATVQDLMDMWRAQNGKCAITGIVMTWAERRGPVPTSISMDRIDPDKGYSKDNIRLICHAVNAFRGRMPDAEMLSLAKSIVAGLERISDPTWQSFPAFTNESDFMVLH